MITQSIIFFYSLFYNEIQEKKINRPKKPSMREYTSGPG